MRQSKTIPLHGHFNKQLSVARPLAALLPTASSIFNEISALMLNYQLFSMFALEIFMYTQVDNVILCRTSSPTTAVSLGDSCRPFRFVWLRRYRFDSTNRRLPFALNPCCGCSGSWLWRGRWSQCADDDRNYTGVVTYDHGNLSTSQRRFGVILERGGICKHEVSHKPLLRVKAVSCTRQTKR